MTLPRVSWLALAVAAPSLLGCSPIPATQILFHFSAVGDVRAEAATLRVVIETQEGDVALDRTKDLAGSAAELARVPVIPRDDNASRIVTAVGELRNAEGDLLGVQRAVARFSREATTEVFLTFDDSCVSPGDCGAGRTCLGGVCVGACVTPVAAGESDRTPPTCGECEACVAGACAAAADGTACGCDGDVCESGACALAVRFQSVAAAEAHSCAFTVDGDVYCWGANDEGQVGVGRSADDLPRALTPQEVDVGTTKGDRRALVARADTSCVLEFFGDTGGAHRCWGSNLAGQFGDGEDSSFYSPNPWHTSPVDVQTEPDFEEFSLGAAHACGRAQDNAVWCWGLGENGQLGRQLPEGILVDPVPTAIDSAVRWRALSAGGEQHACAIATDGALWCWGLNESGQLGVGDTAWREGIVEAACVGGGADCPRDWAQVAAGLFYTCAIREGGALWCWGGNKFGQTGRGTSGNEESVPREVEAGATWASVAAGGVQTCAIREDDRSLWCWGAGDQGQLGTGARASSDTPVQVAGRAGGWAMASAGDTHVCAVGADGSLWCWGANAEGQLGIGTTSSEGVTTPRRVCVTP